jgi:hypothetical protein
MSDTIVTGTNTSRLQTQSSGLSQVGVFMKDWYRRQTSHNGGTT